MPSENETGTPKRPKKITLPSVATYMTNVGRSIKLASIDYLKDIAPNTAEFIDTNEEVFKEVYSATVNYRQTFRKAGIALKKSKIWEAYTEGRKALLEDLTTGNWYNKEREDAMGMRAMDMGMDDLDVDFDESMFSFDDDDMSDTAKQTRVLDVAIETAARASAKATGEAGGFVAQTVKDSTTLLWAQNEKLMGTITAGMGSLNESITNITRFMNEGPLMTYMQNSKTFQEKSLENSDKLMAMMDEFLKMQRALYEEKRTRDVENPYDEVIDFEGIPDIREYAKQIGKNLKGFAGPEFDMLFGDSFGKNANMLLSFVGSPLKFIPEMFIKKLVPEMVKKGVESFDETMSGVFSTLISRFNKWEDEGDGIRGILGKLFGLKMERKTSVDTGKFKKGPIPFDGITKQSIVEVIPGHLRRIEAALTGQAERIYDMSNGKWTDIMELQKRLAQRQESAATSGFMDVREDFDEFIQQLKQNNTKENAALRDQLVKDLNAISKRVYEDGGYFAGYKHVGDLSAPSYYGISDDNYKLIMRLLTGETKDDKGNLVYKNANKMAKLARNVMSERESMNSYLRSIEEDGGAMLNLFNGAYDVKTRLGTIGAPEISKGVKYRNVLADSTDEYQKNIFWYVRNILGEIQGLRERGIASAGTTSAPTVTAGGIILPHGNPIPPVGPATKTPIQRLEEQLQKEKEKADKERAEKNKKQEQAIVATGKSAEEIERLMDEERHKNDQKSEEQTESFLAKWRQAQTFGERWKAVQDSINDMMSKPSIVITNMLDRADRKIFEMMYGKQAEMDLDDDERTKRPGGVVDMMLIKLEESFDAFNDWMKETIMDPVKKWLDEIGVTRMWNKAKGKLKEGANWVGEKLHIKDVADAIKKKMGWAGSQVRDSFDGTAYDLYGITEQDIFRRFSPSFNRFQFMLDRPDKKNKNLSLATATRERMQSEFDAALQAGRSPAEAYEAQQKKMEELLGKYKTKKEETAKKIQEQEDARHNKVERALTKAEKEDRLKKAAERLGYQSDDEIKRFRAFDKALFYRFIGRPKFKGKLKQTQLKEALNIYRDAIVKENKKPQDAFKKVIEEYKLADTTQITDEDFAASGKLVTERGLAVVSPGERIIPATRSKAGQARQLAREKTFANSLGTKGLNFYAQGKDADEESLQQGSTGDSTMKGKMAQFAELDDVQAAWKTVKKVATEINDSPSIVDMVADALIGGGVSLVTGMIGGPILGAAAGAGIGLIKNSKTVNEMMFGKQITDSEGNVVGRDGSGLISKKTQDIFNKYFPDMKKYGIVGGVLGLITPLGLVGGMMAGGAIGFLKNNDDMQTYLFGPADEKTGERDGGLISKAFRDKVKKAAPRMLLGAAGAALLGPFGLIGNAFMGSALGFITTTDGFHKAIFGEDDGHGGTKGGVLNAIKHQLVVPVVRGGQKLFEETKELVKKNLKKLKNFADPVAQMIKNGIFSVADRISNFFNTHVTTPIADVIGHKFLEPLVKMGSKLLKLPIAMAKGVISAPFSIAQGIGNNIRASQIAKGSASDMTASQRVEFRNKHKGRQAWHAALGNDKFGRVDRMLATQYEGKEGLDQLKEMRDNAALFLNTKKELDKRTAKLTQELVNKVSDILNNSFMDDPDTGAHMSVYTYVTYKAVKRINKCIFDGDIDGALKEIHSGKFIRVDMSVISELEEVITTMGKPIKDAWAAKNDYKATQKRVQFGLFKATGLTNRGDIMNLKRNLDKEIEVREKEAKAEESEEELPPDEARRKELIENQFGITNDILQNESNKVQELLAGIRDHLKTLVDYGQEEKEEEAPAEEAETPEAGVAPTGTVEEVAKEAERQVSETLDPHLGDITIERNRKLAPRPKRDDFESDDEFIDALENYADENNFGGGESKPTKERFTRKGKLDLKRYTAALNKWMDRRVRSRGAELGQEVIEGQQEQPSLVEETIRQAQTGDTSMNPASRIFAEEDRVRDDAINRIDRLIGANDTPSETSEAEASTEDEVPEGWDPRDPDGRKAAKRKERHEKRLAKMKAKFGADDGEIKGKVEHKMGLGQLLGRAKRAATRPLNTLGTMLGQVGHAAKESAKENFNKYSKEGFGSWANDQVAANEAKAEKENQLRQLKLFQMNDAEKAKQQEADGVEVTGGILSGKPNKLKAMLEKGYHVVTGDDGSQAIADSKGKMLDTSSKAAVKEAQDHSQSLMQRLVGGVEKTASGITGFVSGLFGSAWNAGKKVVGGIMGGVSNLLSFASPVFNVLKLILGGATLIAATGHFSEFWTNSIWNPVLKPFVTEKLPTFFTGLADNVEKFIDKYFPSFSGTFETIKNGISSFAGGVADFFQNPGEKISKWFTSGFEKFGDYILEPLGQIIWNAVHSTSLDELTAKNRELVRNKYQETDENGNAVYIDAETGKKTTSKTSASGLANEASMTESTATEYTHNTSGLLGFANRVLNGGKMIEKTITDTHNGDKYTLEQYSNGLRVIKNNSTGSYAKFTIGGDTVEFGWKVDKEGNPKDPGMENVLVGAGLGALVGYAAATIGVIIGAIGTTAAAGSVIPGAGTVVGAAVGTVAGIGIYAFKKATGYTAEAKLEMTNSDEALQAAMVLLSFGWHGGIDKDNDWPQWSAAYDESAKKDKNKYNSGDTHPAKSSGKGRNYLNEDTVANAGKFAGTTEGGSGRARNGHIYQKAQDIASKKMGDSTLGESGCGPVAATNLINKMGGNMDVETAAKYAESAPGFIDKSTGGTTTGYVQSILNKSGVGGQQTTDKQSMMNAIAAGQPTVLLGESGKAREDASRTPFGKNSHYITAMGMDRSGNIIAEDPDLPDSYVKYKASKVMNDTNAGIISGGMGRYLQGSVRGGSVIDRPAYRMSGGDAGRTILFQSKTGDQIYSNDELVTWSTKTSAGQAWKYDYDELLKKYGPNYKKIYAELDDKHGSITYIDTAWPGTTTTTTTTPSSTGTQTQTDNTTKNNSVNLAAYDRKTTQNDIGSWYTKASGARALANQLYMLRTGKQYTAGDPMAMYKLLMEMFQNGPNRLPSGMKQKDFTQYKHLWEQAVISLNKFLLDNRYKQEHHLINDLEDPYITVTGKTGAMQEDDVVPGVNNTIQVPAWVVRAGGIIFSQEGSYDTINKQDGTNTKSMSIGKLQWNWNAGRAQPILKKIIDALVATATMTGSAIKEMLGAELWDKIYGSIGGAVVCKDAWVSGLKKLLGTDVSKNVQDEEALTSIQAYASSKYIKQFDPATQENVVIYLCDIANQYGQESKCVKTVTTTAINKAGGVAKNVTLDQVHEAALEYSTKYKTRRTEVYTALKNSSPAGMSMVSITSYQIGGVMQESEQVAKEASNTIWGQLKDAVYSMFRAAYGPMFDALFGGESSGDGSYSSSGSSGVDAGFNNWQSTTGQNAVVDWMRKIKGTISYGLGSTQDPDKGTASCASTVGWAYRKALGVTGMSASSTEQSKDSRFTTIWTNKGGGLTNADIANLRPGDILYQNWNQTKNNGSMKHTEMYQGDAMDISHGGPGKGPVDKQLNDYRRQHTMMIRRYTPFYNGEQPMFTNADGTPGVYDNFNQDGTLTGTQTKTQLTDGLDALNAGLGPMSDEGAVKYNAEKLAEQINNNNPAFQQAKNMGMTNPWMERNMNKQLTEMLTNAYKENEDIIKTTSAGAAGAQTGAQTAADAAAQSSKTTTEPTAPEAFTPAFELPQGLYSPYQNRGKYTQPSPTAGFSMYNTGNQTPSLGSGHGRDDEEQQSEKLSGTGADSYDSSITTGGILARSGASRFKKQFERAKTPSKVGSGSAREDIGTAMPDVTEAVPAKKVKNANQDQLMQVVVGLLKVIVKNSNRMGEIVELLSRMDINLADLGVSIPELAKSNLSGTSNDSKVHVPQGKSGGSAKGYRQHGNSRLGGAIQSDEHDIEYVIKILDDMARL